jgi:lipopolysaccharide transport system ATP-binding protein
VRLLAVRARHEDGRPADTIDIREPMRIEIEFDVHQPGHVLVPNIHVFNEDGVQVFIAQDLDPLWRGRPRPIGRYRASARIPGHFWNDGTIVIGAAISTMEPVFVHVHEPEAIAFDVVDGFSPDSARGDYAGPMPGVIRPMLQWTNEVVPANAADKDSPQ